MLCLGRIKGIKITLHYSFAILFFGMTYILMKVWLYDGANKVFYNFSVSFFFTFIFFIGVYLHELAHAVQMIKANLKVEKISFAGLAAGAHTDDYFKNPKEEIKIASAGLIVTTIIAIFWYCLYFLAKVMFGLTLINSDISSFLFFQFLINSLGLIINIIPAFPTDSGRILRALFWKKSGNLIKLTITATHISRIISIVAILSIFTKYGSGWYVLVAVLVLVGSYHELEYVKTGKDVDLKKMTKELLLKIDSVRKSGGKLCKKNCWLL